MIRLDEIKLSDFKRAYFIGIGGIGMSALARYFNGLGWEVAGYDKTKTTLSLQLETEGITIHYEDWGPSIPEQFKQKEEALIVYTPAIPKNLGELLFFQNAEALLLKRSEVLGLLTHNSLGLGVAGTHGKTTTSSMLAHILTCSTEKCNAFLGGIATNFNSNLVVNLTSKYTVIEADEFDRSFLKLLPFASIVTSTDPDHLDIYGDEKVFLEGFQMYAKLIHKEGILVKKEGLDISSSSRTLTYAIDSATADFSGINLNFDNGIFKMDIVSENEVVIDVEMGIPGIHNAENALACYVLCRELGITESEIRLGLKTFLGVKRRFEYCVREKNRVYIDDYAHHPTEIKSLVASIRLLYPTMKVIGIFQPHLFSRTKDFMDDFAKELSRLDEVVLLPIYPAREEPISGITSDVLLEKITIEHKKLMSPDQILTELLIENNTVYLTIGAGDIDRLVLPLTQKLR